MDISLNMSSDKPSDEIIENSKNKANWVHRSNINTLAMLFVERNKEKSIKNTEKLKKLKKSPRTAAMVALRRLRWSSGADDGTNRLR